MNNEILPVGTATLLRQACDKYVATFGREPVAAASAPGRVNLIGEHIDYCEGYVLPAALPFETIIVGGYNNTDSCNVLSVMGNKDSQISFPSTEVAELKPGLPSWSNYVKGTIANFPDPVKGFDAVIVSDVPVGAGLSSSAALEVAVFTFLEALTGYKIDPIQKAKLCQKAEHEFPGVPCGIMDQYIVAMGKKNHALLIDCQSLQATQIPLDLGDHVILVTNSNVKHELTGSEYPQRRAQCQEAADKLGLPSLRGAKIEDLEELKRLNCNKLVIMRAQHVIEEIYRTSEVAESLRRNDLDRVGKLFFQSHYSLSKLMEVSCPELDELVEIMKDVPGVLGARMTGGGFGGCVVTLVKKDQVDNLKRAVVENYKGNPTFLICQPNDGARTHKL
ncbi:galactokinase-like isoform X2 [Galleria mellonella]|nr:galactokinase-like isoform X2 [Galleria mellonella]